MHYGLIEKLPEPFAFKKDQKVKTPEGQSAVVVTVHSPWTVFLQVGSKAGFYSTVGLTAVEVEPTPPDAESAASPAFPQGELTL